MHLKTAVHKYLDSIGDSQLFFFNSKNTKCSLIGCIRGQLVCMLILEGKRNVSRQEIRFSAKILQAGGEHYVIRSLDDVCEIAKIRGWHD